MPFCVWNMRVAFQAIPHELEESAFLDGADVKMAFLRITLPLALPSIAIAGLLAFLMGYSEFAMGWMFIQTDRNVTLAMAISGMLGTFARGWNNLAALAVMMTVPVVLLFWVLQRYLLSGLLIGNLEE